MQVKAIVVKRSTEDGVTFLRDEVPIGFAYLADTLDICTMSWYNTKTSKTTDRPCIWCKGSYTGIEPVEGYMPMELFKLEE
jgi:hypothetical protein